MTCPRCRAENSAGMRFCGYCGARLSGGCPSCGAENPTENKFCGSCAAPLGTPNDGGYGELSRALAGELKQVSILFCDMVDSTAVTERLGAEAMHELIRWFIDTALEKVHRYGGSAPQFTGDGFMALFGAPIMYEDHVRRALLAAVEIRDAVSGSAGLVTSESHGLRIRMGIHTGLVVFGSIGGNLRMDPTAIGDAANVAARLQGAAAPGAILISEETRQLARGYVRIEPVGPLNLKGKDKPISAYRLLGVSHHLIPEEESPSLRPFVNRTSEMALLMELVRPVDAGRCQALGIVGEPGIGKSRLIAEFRSRLGDAMTWTEGRCLSYSMTIPYLLILDLLRGVCGIAEADAPEIVVEKLRSALQEVGMAPDQDAPLLLHLLGIEAGGDASALSSPEAVKEKAFAILSQLFVDRSRNRPLVLVLEDLHWIDQVSNEFLSFLAESINGSRILLIATYRPGYRPPWIDRSFAGQLPLRPLSRADSLDVVRSARADLDEIVTEAIIEKADGNPLFLEQLALHAGEAPDDHSVGLVPNTIHDVVMARLDRLPDETKRLLQSASVIGRAFSKYLLRAVWEGANPIEPQLRALVRLEFIDERGENEPNDYVFRHALTRETAYASLLESYRRRLHAAVGYAVEKLYEERTDEVAEQLAYHFCRTDEADKAVDYAIQAAEKSQRRWANSEALGYFDDALRRLDAMTDNEVNRLRRIDAVLKQAEIKYALGRLTEHVYALEKIRRIVDESEAPRHRATWHYWMGFLHSLSGGRPEIASEHCREAAKIASAAEMKGIDALAASCLAQVYIVGGKPRDAVESGERALRHFEARGDRWWAGRTLWLLSSAANCLGDWEASRDYCRRGLQHGFALADLRLKVIGWSRMGQAYIQQGDIERGLQSCDEALALAPIPRDAAWTRVIRGYGKIKSGQVDSGITELNEALLWFETSQMRFSHIIGATWLAEGYLSRGNRAAARTVIDYVLTTSRATGYLQYEGRASWLMAEWLSPEAPETAEDHLETALRIFTQIGARNDFARAILTRAALRREAGDVETASRLTAEAEQIFRQLGTRGVYGLQKSLVEPKIDLN